ncbi:ABC transporter ATP-binding protein [Streptomyces sp. A1499]|uniref:ABC transporter ATP-binding protein n=1 Tax=Streptomyces sp. A1499 TaxID=2563104 RepID=UPI00109EDD14|nr:ABC transporter ATP-binding protein [Streptomyces sp. A1499]THC44449.1 ABC transporter ATP-binding protein [Streptomyces sp. A1499]
MIQAIGLTSNARQELPPAVDDVSFEARTGRVTALLGAEAAGKTTALRLMLELQQGRGVTYFRGRPLHRIAQPSREVGVLLGEVPGHPARSVRNHLRMLCAAVAVPITRADDVLEAVGLVSLRDQHLGTLSRGMDRRLGLACALLADPHALVLDGPAEGLSARESAWLHEILRAHADQGGTVLFTTDDPKEAARTADRVVTLDEGRLIADQEATDFARTRLRPRVVVLTPHAARLGALLTKEARAARKPVEVVREEGNRLSVYGSNCAEVGETAYRHGILVHQLADELGDAGPSAPPGPPTQPKLSAEPALAVALTASGECRTAGVNGPVQARVGLPAPPAQSRDEPQPQPQPPTTRAKEDAQAQSATTGHAPLAQLEGSPPAQADIDTLNRNGDTPQQPLDTATAAQAEPEAAAATQTEPDAAAPALTEEGEAEPSRVETAAIRLVPLRDADRAPLAQDDSTAPRTGGPHPPAPPPPTPASALPPPIAVRPGRTPLWPLRYELRRLAGVGTGYLTLAAVLAASAVISLVVARVGHTPQPRLLAAWPNALPLPPAALGAGLLGALAFGDEFRYPALAADRGTVPRRLSLLAAKLLVAAATALLLGALAVGADAALLHLVYGEELVGVPGDWLVLCASWVALLTGCAWAGVLAAGVFRSTTAGLAAVLAVPILVVPVVQKTVDGPAVRSAAGFPGRLRDLALVQWPFGSERILAAGVRMLAQPVGTALMLSLTTLLCAYLLTTVRGRVR